MVKMRLKEHQNTIQVYSLNPHEIDFGFFTHTHTCIIFTQKGRKFHKISG